LHLRTGGHPRGPLGNQANLIRVLEATLKRPRRGPRHPAGSRPPTIKEYRRRRATPRIFTAERAASQGHRCWLNDFGKLRRCTERRRDCIDAYLALAAAIVTIRALLRSAWYRYRWNTRPRSPRIR